MPYNDFEPLFLGQVANPTAATVLYTVPAGERALLKGLTIANTTGGALSCNVFLVPDGGSPAAATALKFGVSIAANTSVEYTTLQVLHGGDTLQVQGSATGLTFTASGARVT